MKAAFFHQTGPPEVIQFGDLPDAKPQPNQVLVRVRAVAMNPIDTYIRGGLIKPNRVLRHLLIPVSELDRFLTEGQR